MAAELSSVLGYHNIKNIEARELLQPYMQTDGYYLLRPSADSKGGVLCTICVTNRSKLVNYRLVKDHRVNCYYIHSHTSFPSIQLLLSHYKTTPINAEVHTRLLNPVLTKEQQKMVTAQPEDADTYVIMERTEETPPPSQEDGNSIPGLHLYLPKNEINTVMSKYLNVDGHYLIRPSASSEGQLTLAVSNSGKVLNFKIMNNGGSEFYISPRRKFPSALALLQAYRSAPIRSKKTGSAKIFLLHPIPVDSMMEQRHKKAKEEKAARKVSSPTRTAQDPLPSPWQQHMHEQYKKTYYYNPQTKESTWDRPKATPPSKTLTLPPKMNGHQSSSPASGKKMRDRPLPVLPGEATPTTNKTMPTSGAPPPLPPGRGVERPAQNGSLQRQKSPRINPPLPPKENGPPSHATPTPKSANTRPQLPLPNTPTAPQQDRRSFPPLPPKEDTPNRPPAGRVVPPLPPKEDSAPVSTLSRKGHDTSKHEKKRIVEYEDIVIPKVAAGAPPPLPEKEVPPVTVNDAGRAPPPPPPTRGGSTLTMGATPSSGRPPPTLPTRGDVPALPTRDMPALPTRDMPALPTRDMPALPTRDMPTLPTRGDVPALPTRDMPALPTRDMPALPTRNDVPPPLPPNSPMKAPAGGVPAPPPAPPLGGISAPPPAPPLGGMSAPPPPPPLGGISAPPPAPPLGGVPAPPPPPPMAPPPPSPAPSRANRSGSESLASTQSTSQGDNGSGRPFGANDLMNARTLLRRRAETNVEEVKEQPSGFAGIFASAIDNRRKAIEDSDSDESEFEDVDDEDWDD